MTAAGFLEDKTRFTAIGNSKGLFGYYKDTSVDFTITARTKDERGSGFAFQNTTDATKLNTTAATEIAINKSISSANAKEMPPGKYTVILEPAALYSGLDNSLLTNLLFALDARNADEGRSFFSKKGGGSKLGERLFNEKIAIYSDPMSVDAPGIPFISDGRPLQKVVWVENGVLKNLYYSRYWAAQKGLEALPLPSGIIITGGNQTLDDLIKSTEKGILVTRFWYIRQVDPQTLLLTGLTRDGTFYIENGAIKYAVKNFRFNESSANILNNVEAIGKPVRIADSMIPPLKIRDFNFTSLSDAV